MSVHVIEIGSASAEGVASSAAAAARTLSFKDDI
jgi:hypothetical protein